ncbi:MAG: radical SAM protein [Candidatus Diapherotrites archaeon]
MVFEWRKMRFFTMASSLEIKPSNFLPFAYNYMRWHFNHYIRDKPFPLIAQFYTSHICNFRCDYCNFWRNPDKRHIPLPRYKSLIDELSGMGTCFVNFTGGEPLILPDIIERIRYTKHKIPYMHVVSNGSLLDEETARALQETGIDAVSISMNAYGSEMDKATGFKGAFRKAVQAVENLKVFAPGVSTSINSVITPWNTAELRKIHALANELGVDHKFQAVSSHPEFKGQRTKATRFKFSDADIGMVRAFTDEMSNEGNVANSTHYLRQVGDYFEGKNTAGLFAEQCITPHYFVEFWGDGAFSPCLTGTGWKQRFSIRDKGLRPILESGEYRDQQKCLENCRTCSTNMQVCIMEPRIFFPLKNFIKYTALPRVRFR